MILPPIRPELLAGARRWQEVLTGAALVLLGLWIFYLGGLLFQPLGGLIAAGGLGWALLGLRRMRFRGPGAGEGPGIVDLLEGQISYLSPLPGRGGFVALPEISEIRLLVRPGERVWKIAQAGEPPVLIPVDALGADRLFDVFAGLPGLDMPALLAALEDREVTDRRIWLRPRLRMASPPADGPG